MSYHGMVSKADQEASDEQYKKFWKEFFPNYDRKLFVGPTILARYVPEASLHEGLIQSREPQDLMRECATLVEQRQKTHGSFRKNMEDYAKELEQQFNHKVLASEAAMVLARNKLSRMSVGDKKVMDHYLDAANYIIFAGILASEGK